jgi:GTP cyclohydrolase II
VSLLLNKRAAAEIAATESLESVDRAVGELRRGRAVLLRAPAGDAVIAAIETLDETGLLQLGKSGESDPVLVLTAPRAAAIGLQAPADQPAGAWRISRPVLARSLHDLADPTILAPAHDPQEFRAVELAAELRQASIELIKLARLLPAALVEPFDERRHGPSEKFGQARGLLTVTAEAIGSYQKLAAQSLRPVGEARVPLAGAEQTRIVAFRPSDGGTEHLAVIIGEPPKDSPVLARIHSECFTGDLLGSLRCDCGDQLRGAIAEIGKQGQGILLYLAQEGRGIGLVNKLRAYRLQDSGADTAEANRQLGFEADERIYLPAAEMLRQLGYQQVRLLTNNPAKVEGLRRCGVAVTERVPHVFPSNGHNERFLATKVARLGHVM